MMGKKRSIGIISILSLAAFCFSISVSAETIILKSGAKIEGKIIERTDKYIKIDFYGVSIPYYFEDIESIDGEIPVLPSAKEKVSAVTQRNVMTWEEWSDSVVNYLDRLAMIEDRGFQTLVQAGEGAKEAIQRGDEALIKQIVVSAINEFSSIAEEIKELNPSQELEQYHQQRIDIFKYFKMFYEAFLNNDIVADAHIRKATTLRIESAEQLKRIFIGHSAPEVVLQNIDIVISEQKQLLKVMQ